MTTPDPIRYLDDPDANIEYPITDRLGGDLDWTSPSVLATSVRTGVVVTLTGAWQGDPGSPRDIRIPLDSLPAGSHKLRLVIPGENDIPLGSVRLS